MRCVATLALTFFAIGIYAQCNVSLTLTSKSVSCYGNCNGTATAALTGGTAPVAYVWSTTPVQYTPTASGLCAGVYSVTVVDANGCSATGVDTVHTPAVLTNSNAVTNVACNGKATGKIIANPAGGTVPYTYSWSNAVTTKINGTLAVGSYSVTVTDNNGCSLTSSAVLTQPDSALVLKDTVTPVTSCGSSTGAIALTVKGGTPGQNGYTYKWNNSATTASLSNVSAGNYIVTVSDANACTVVSSFTLTTTGSTLAIKTVTKTVPTACGNGSNGSIKITLTASTGPYAYSWSTGATAATSALTNTLSAVAAGTYTVSVTDKNGCMASTIATLAAAVPISATFTATRVTCFGGTNGSLVAAAKGGTTPYTYAWSTSPVQTKDTAINLKAATYTLTITDKSGCTAAVVDSVGGPKQLVAAFTLTSPTCNGSANGAIATVVSGGTKAYTYAWSTNPVQKTAGLTKLTAGTYKLTITDSKACSAVDSVVLTQPAVLSYGVTSAPSGCNGSNGTAAVTSLNGGTAPYTYKWNNGDSTASIAALNAGSYTVTVTDANKCVATSTASVTNSGGISLSAVTLQSLVCNGDSNATAVAVVAGGQAPFHFAWNTTPAQVADTAVGLKAGLYAVAVTDSNGCSAQATVQVASPLAIAATFNKTVELCPGQTNGIDTAIVSNGTRPYTYSWSNGQTDSIATGLSGEVAYTLTVTDAKGCSSALSTTIKQLYYTTNNVNAICSLGSNGVGQVLPKGGTAPYTYAWSTSPTQTTAIARGLAAGTYTVTVSDAKGCSLMAYDTIVLPTATVTSVQNALCFNAATGSAKVQIKGGYAPYTYSWSTGVDSATTSSNYTINGLSANSYSVTITDAHSCTASSTLTVGQPAALSVSKLTTSNGCPNCAPTTAVLNVTGGTAPYLYSWSTNPVQYGDTAMNLTAGNVYNFQVTDNNGCMVADTILLNPINTGLANVNGALSGHLQVYPNPTSGQVKLQAQFVKAEDAVVRIYNTTGQLLQETTTKQTTGFMQVIDLSGFANGLYLIELSSSEGISAKHVLIAH